MKKTEHGNIILQNIYNKHGKDNLRFEVLEYCPVDQILIREQHYIDTLNPDINIAQVAGNTTGVRWKQSDAALRKMRRNYRKWMQPVYKIDCFTGEVVNEYESVEAAGKAIGASVGGISNVCLGRQRTYLGYAWQYVDKYNPDEFRTLDKIHRRRLPVHQIDKDTGEIIATHVSIRQAMLAVGGSGPGIYRTVKGEQDESYGYKWRMADE